MILFVLLFPDFKENLRLDFFKRQNVTLQKPNVDLWNLIKADNFFPTLKDYFSKNVEERKKHKLQTVFKFTDINLIGNPESFKGHSIAYRWILGEKAYQDILSVNRLPIFCSLAEFYGKDFFDQLPETKKTMVKKFYSKNEFDFKLSDLSILGNTNEILKTDDDNSNLDSKFEKNGDGIKNNSKNNSDDNEILKTNDDNSNLDSKFEKNGGYIKNDNKNSFENKIFKETANGNQRKEKAKSNYHIGKIIFFVLLAIYVGVFVSWLYALIPIIALIAFVFLDQKFNFVPEFKTIFCCCIFCQSSDRKKEEKNKSPEQDKNASIKNTEI